MKKKYNYINDDVKVDFLVPEKLQEIVDYLEELDADDNAAFYNTLRVWNMWDVIMLSQVK